MAIFVSFFAFLWWATYDYIDVVSKACHQYQNSVINIHEWSPSLSHRHHVTNMILAISLSPCLCITRIIKKHYIFSFSFSICTLFECTGQKMRSFCDFDQPFLWDDGFLSTPRFGFQRFYGKNKNVQKWRRNASDKNWRRLFSENGEKTTESGLESSPTFKFCLILVQSLLNTSA